MAEGEKPAGDEAATTSQPAEAATAPPDGGTWPIAVGAVGAGALLSGAPQAATAGAGDAPPVDTVGAAANPASARASGAAAASGPPPADQRRFRPLSEFECPICCRTVPHVERAPQRGLDGDVLALASANTPGWRPDFGLCRGCAQRFAEARDALVELHKGGGVVILPTALRLGAVERYRGRGVGLAFLDAGFFAHPDLVAPDDRILHYLDVTSRKAKRRDLRRGDESSWHGMMTSVVACGNGSLSGGFYRGLASEARLVLVKCGSVRRIRHDDIALGLKWVVRHAKAYGIRVINVSCGGDYQASYLHDGLSQAAEWAAREGLLVVAAAGNRGRDPEHPVLPPASAPSVLTVGGLDDQRWPAFSGYEMYHSSYGPTLDGLQKPEVIAPGIWIAAPILPGTPTAAQAELLSRLATTPDARLRDELRAHAGVDRDLDAALGLEPPLLRQLVLAKLRDNNVISGSYKHVDGTSFAAPIVSSIAAQMFEAHPRLTPRQAKRILMQTARRLPYVDPDRQGWGVVDARAAVLEAERLARGAPEK
jgi:serine protease AprX